MDGVEEKTGRGPDLILVVGGFGCSKFLQSELCRNLGHSNVAFTGEDGMIAVKHGAAIYGALRNFVAMNQHEADQFNLPRVTNVPPTIYIRSRVARYSYGYSVPNGAWNAITWFVTKGQDVDFSATFTLPRNAFIFTIQNRPCAVIYRSPQSAPSNEEARQECRIKCERPDILGQLQSVPVRMRLMGSGMQFEVHGAGNEQETTFTVLYPY
ncbi:uncharacterized protein B0T15DRAFT_213970 [Chaetomium strumarium]|uniref:Uncharacterized protein n=1 Tax=Chaetomium strumarium TaxID=1170767 RepID=A0AAJ0M1U9_9PEZI|nr:hypothetical protein B0T15DRAFT_213970 [Chaetomium strumarium]